MLADQASFGATFHRGRLTRSNLLTPNERPLNIPFLLQACGLNIQIFRRKQPRLPYDGLPARVANVRCQVANSRSIWAFTAGATSASHICSTAKLTRPSQPVPFIGSYPIGCRWLPEDVLLRRDS